MAAYSSAYGEQGVYDKTLGAGVVDTVTINKVTHNVQITTDGASPIFFTVDGTTPSVGSQAAYHLPARAMSANFVVPSSSGQGPFVVSLVSAGTPVYSVNVTFATV